MDPFSKKQIKTIIFDLDGTLVDSMAIYIESIKHILSLCDVSIILRSNEVMPFAGLPAEVIYTHFLKKEGVYDSSKKEYLKNEFNKKFAELLDNKKDYFPKDSTACISQLKKKGYNIAIGTGASRAGTEKMVPKDTQDLLDTIITVDDVSTPKPNPETFLKAASLIDTDPDVCVVVGDGVNDFLAARDAKMSFILIKNSHNQDFDMVDDCDYVIDDLSELLDIF
ncbi:MAG: HAD-IA family hydrolase [Nanohaloarchaea archaeon]|nr:HAD-IA family hydrolase [Candidatus Nanohaloarchaea archaeon]